MEAKAKQEGTEGAIKVQRFEKPVRHILFREELAVTRDIIVVREGV